MPVRSAPGTAGQPLPGLVRQDMEALFDADFSDVRVHVGPQADALGAFAFAWGSHLFFAPDAYQPETRAGRHLLAHELTHVLQQRAERAGKATRAEARVVLDPVLEAEAERMGRLAARRATLPRRAAARPSGPASAPVAGSVIQPSIRVASGAGKGYYDLLNKADFVTALKVDLAASHKGGKGEAWRQKDMGELLNGKLSHVGAPDIYEFATMADVANWLIQTYQPTPTANAYAPIYQFDDDHGGLHFINKPTDKKSAWDLTKANAQTLMTTEMNKHLSKMFQGSSVTAAAPWTAWYVCGVHGANVGRYKDDTREGADTKMFTIQAQINVRENVVTYHGFPDERVVKYGIGQTKATVA